MLGPKEKKERLLGEHMHLKAERCNSPKCALIRKPYRPGMHGQKYQRKSLSEFGRQVREKQKFKVSYGLDERNLRRIYKLASRRSGATTSQLLELLERRLDNVVFRLGFAASRPQARKYVVDGHITVNGKKVVSPGYLVREGDSIGIRESSRNISNFKELADRLKKYEPPAWLFLDKIRLEGKIVSLPREVEVPFEVNLLVESFSK